MHKNKLFILGGLSKYSNKTNEGVIPYGVKKKKPGFVSLFSGAMGLDLGLEEAGFNPLGCLELDKWACETIKHNRPEIPRFCDDIRNWSGDKILQEFPIKKEDVMVVVGGPPCPSFSTAGKRQSFNDPRGEVMFDFLRIVKEISPPFFVMENVRGILSASIKHRPLDKRTKKYGALSPEEMHGSVLRMLNKYFKDMGYVVTAELVNTANYGTPQKRERVIFLGSKEGFQITMPIGNYSKDEDMFSLPWRTLKDAFQDLKDPSPEFIPYSEVRLKYLRLLKEGQNWRNLPEHLIKEAMGGAYESGGGKVGFYRRLSYNKPCPTVPTSPMHKSTCICHPRKLRPLSVNEYARVQQFPDSWKFQGSIANKYKQIGNAVPVGLGYAIGKALLRYIKNYEEL